MRQLGIALAQYQTDNDDAFPNTGDPYLWVGRRMRWPLMPYLSIGQKQKPGTFDSETGSPAILICPSDRTATSTFDSTSYAMSLTLYQAPQTVDLLQLRNTIPGLNQPGPGAITTTQTHSQAQEPARKIAFTEWLNSHSFDRVPTGFWGTLKPGLIPGDDRWKGARNATFLDGHAKFTKAAAQSASADDCPDMNLTPGGLSGSDLR